MHILARSALDFKQSLNPAQNIKNMVYHCKTHDQPHACIVVADMNNIYRQKCLILLPLAFSGSLLLLNLLAVLGRLVRRT